jgi:hypothetical protein
MSNKHPLSRSQGGGPFMKGLTLSFEGVLGNSGPRRDSSSSGVDNNDREGT